MVNVSPMILGQDITTPFKFITIEVSPDWADYNGHMNECMYLFVASLGYEGFAKYIGIDPEWAKTKGSYFTVENHNVYMDECSVGEALYVNTQLLDADEKRLHLLNHVHRVSDDALVFTSENLNVYVNPISRKAEPVSTEIFEKIQLILTAHKDLDKKFSGRVVGIRRK